MVLYIFASGDIDDGLGVNTAGPASTGAQSGEENPSSANSLEALAPAREGPPATASDRLSALQPATPTRPKSWGSPLEKAVFLGDIETVAALLDEGADINAPAAGGGTLLVLAAQNGDEAMVSYLIARGANPSFGTIDATDPGSDGLFPNDGSTGGRGHLPNPEDRRARFHGGGKPRIAGPDAGPDETSRGKLGRELLLSTAGDGGTGTDRDTNRSASASASSEGSATETDPAVSPNLGVTPLIAAARSGHADVVGVLLASGAKVNVADTRGQTPLMAAVNAGDAESARLLLARDADVRAVDDTGRSALDMARQNSRWDLVERDFRPRRADRDGNDRNDRTGGNSGNGRKRRQRPRPVFRRPPDRPRRTPGKPPRASSSRPRRAAPATPSTPEEPCMIAPASPGLKRIWAGLAMIRARWTGFPGSKTSVRDRRLSKGRRSPGRWQDHANVW